MSTSIALIALAGCLPELKDAQSQLASWGSDNGISYSFPDFAGLRDPAITAEILKYRDDDYAAARAAGDPDALSMSENDWRPIAQYGHSYHDYGAAFDIVIESADPAQWSDKFDALSALKQIAPQFGLRSTVAHDPGHFELAITLEEAKARFFRVHPK